MKAVSALLVLAFLAAGADPITINGRVTDETGVAVQGAHVQIGSARALSDTAGNFSFRLEAPGTFSIHAEQEGFFKFERSALELHEGVNEISITLNHLKDFADSVNVTFSPPVIDPQQTTEKKELNNQEILQVPYPASQDFRSSLPMLPGVVQDTVGHLHFNGGATNQTNYTLNGFNISDPATGRLEVRLNVEAVQTLELETSRFSPERGRGSAGSLDVKTEMGDDHWRFTGTNFVPGVGSQDGFHIDKWTPRVKVSGPLVKGRVWFHNAFDTFYDLNTVPGLPHGENRSRSFITSDLTRVQINFSPTNIFIGSFLLNHGQDTRQGLSFLDPAETTVNRRQDLKQLALKDQIVFRNGALLELGFAGTTVFFRASPQGSNMFQISPGGNAGNYFLDLKRRSHREQGIAHVYLPAWRWHGSHQLQTGVDFQHESFDRREHRNPYERLRLDRSVVQYTTFQGNGRQVSSDLQDAGYLLDRWTPLEALLVEGGVRLDWNNVIGRTLLSPRISAAYAPKWLRETKVAGGYGIYYDVLTLDTLALSQEQVSLSTFYGVDGQISRGPVQTAFQLNDSQLRLPRYHVASFSAERKLPFDFYGRMNLTRKQGSRGFAFVSQFATPETNLYSLQNFRRDRYQAAEFSLRRTFARQYEWSFSYTRSRALSNSVIDYNLENPIFAPQAGGPLPWDTPNRFVMWGWAPLPRKQLARFLRPLIGDTSASFLAEYRSGFPFSVINEEGFLVGSPNRIRYPDYFNVNLHFERRFHLKNNLWAWRVGLNNLTNNPNPNVVNNNVNSPQYLTFGRSQTRAVAVRLRYLGKR